MESKFLIKFSTKLSIQVGGFSMASSPSLLKSQGLLELAVKTSRWAPANWVHTKCTVGDWVTFRFSN